MRKPRRDRKPRVFEFRGYWLERCPKAGTWLRCWYDRADRASGTRRASLGTLDLDAAKDALVAWVSANERASATRPDSVTLARAFQRYTGGHARHVARADVLRWSQLQWLKHFGTATVADLTPARMRDFVAELTQRMSSGSARRVIADGVAAFNWMHREHELDSVPHIALPPANEPRQRIASLHEIAALMLHGAAHLRRFLWISLATGARPSAVLELTRDRIDFGAGLIELNPHGRTQSKKRRPLVPIAPAVLPLLQDMTGNAAPSGHLVAFEGRPIACIRMAFRHTAKRVIRHEARRALALWRLGYRRQALERLAEAKRRIGALIEVTPYTLRHTFSAELYRRGVPLDEIAAFLGHVPRLRITAMYAKTRNPESLGRALGAIDAYLSDLRTLLAGGPSEGLHQPSSGRIADDGLPDELQKTPLELVELIGIEPTTSSLRTSRNGNNRNGLKPRKTATDRSTRQGDTRRCGRKAV